MRDKNKLKKLLTLLTIGTIGLTPVASVVSCGTQKNTNSDNNNENNNNETTAADLIKRIELGEIDIPVGQTKVSNEQIKEAVCFKNDIDSSKVKITNKKLSHGKGTANVEVAGYQDLVQVSFTYVQEHEISEFIKTLELGEIDIPVGQKEVTKEQIKDLVAKLNNIDLSEIKVDDKKLTDGKGTAHVHVPNCVDYATVTFTYKQLHGTNEVITKTDLGEITIPVGQTKVSIEQIKDAVAKVNSAVDSDKISITGKEMSNGSGTANVHVEGYVNAVSVSFTYVQQHATSEVITETDLGEITIPVGQEEVTKEQIKDAVAKVNSAVDSDKISITGKEMSNGSGTANVHVEGYVNAVSVSFTYVQQHATSEVITKTDLGEITIPVGQTKVSIEQIKDAVVKVNNIDLTKIDLDKITITGKKMSGGKGTANVHVEGYVNAVSVSFTYVQQHATSEVITKTNLGEITIPVGQEEVTKEQIKDAVAKANSAVDSDKISITGKEMSNGSGTANVHVEGYVNAVSVSFTYVQQHATSEVIIETNLGEITIPVGQAKVSIEQIKDAVVKVNNIDLTKIDLDKITITGKKMSGGKGTANVHVEGYVNAVSVSFTYVQQHATSEVITETNLGEITIPFDKTEVTVDQIKDLVAKLNGIDSNKITVSNINSNEGNGTADVEVSGYVNAVSVSFTYVQEKKIQSGDTVKKTSDEKINPRKFDLNDQTIENIKAEFEKTSSNKNLDPNDIFAKVNGEVILSQVYVTEDKYNEIKDSLGAVEYRKGDEGYLSSSQLENGKKYYVLLSFWSDKVKANLFITTFNDFSINIEIVN